MSTQTFERPASDGRAWLSLIPTASLVAVAPLLFVARRAFGALVQPLSAGDMLLAGALLALAVIAAAWMANGQRRVGSRWFAAPSVLAAFGAAALVALSITLPGGLIMARALLWVPLAGAAMLIARPPLALQSVLGGMLRRRARGASNSREQLPSGDTRLVQSLSRWRDESGAEIANGELAIEFAVGQCTAIAQIAFTPPLAGPPRVDLEQLEGPDARLEVAERLAWGLAIEVRLTAPSAKPAVVLVAFSAAAESA